MNVAFIPVRGGSKSIPLKNIKPMCGKPLVYWTAAAACACRAIDLVYIATDSVEIRQAVEGFRGESEAFEKIHVIERSAESASDTASTEFAMLEFAANYEFDHIVLIQATSPLLTSEELERGFALYGQKHTDSVLSVVRQKRFHWAVNEEGNAYPTNYDVYHRPRRQEFDGYLVENGAFYITSKKRLLESKNRVSGKISVCEMPEDTFLEIDEPEDWVMIEHLLKKRLKKTPSAEKAAKIKMFLTDCDGCLTDGGMYYTETGDMGKRFCTQDGLGFRLLRESGILCGIITGENAKPVVKRAEKLKLDICRIGVHEKLSVIRELCEQYKVSLSEIAYVGDDVNDLETLGAVGLSFSVPNAVEQVKEMADVVTSRRGGDGAVREAADYILKMRQNSADA